MKKSTSISHILQLVIPEEDMRPILEELQYTDVARKFTVYDLFLFLAEAAFQQWDGYRDGAQRMSLQGQRTVNYSTLSKKAKAVPFSVFKRLLNLMLGLCNRKTKRTLGIPKDLLIVDSTTISVGQGRLPWAQIKGRKAGVKLHVGLLGDSNELHKVTETPAIQHDLNSCAALLDSQFILVGDRAYGKHQLFDRYQEQKERQYFVIRLKDNTTLANPIPRLRNRPFEGGIEQDLTCQLGKKKALSENRFRVVILKDPKGNPVILATNLHWHSPEAIAEIYKKRWQIEVFFRWIKQHLNIPKLFGTTENAVYGQLYVALLVYVLLKFLFEQGNRIVHASARLTFANFDRLFALHKLPVEWRIYLAQAVHFINTNW
ncbi:IS4 family transposase [Paenibacillus sp. MMS20-IR301]|uniref:IS4 family transposase n=1 Tax=Paenibacillus sp. MMS20-IR301 TaxID=2895946 RepID=UPI0028E98D53|nr:IS4 family transposase [Paenibacillus sp. MMS20-IR301]WNS41140.1 IS4 family transposase [Paenibacillus sp. MMS20-IR301]WNS42494.1 IS4 family transposase [Paenibacillus sp. MMS20-IR301]WNS45476.1 IS4 family transposase [Paenibacillus sp. MMS20-IR301]